MSQGTKKERKKKNCSNDEGDAQEDVTGNNAADEDRVFPSDLYESPRKPRGS